MQNEVIPRLMYLISYLEVCMAFPAGNQNHIPMFPMIGSDRTLQSHHWIPIISRDNPKQPGIFWIPYDPEQFSTQIERPSRRGGQSIVNKRLRETSTAGLTLLLGLDMKTT